jgi:hypothetical protein
VTARQRIADLTISALVWTFRTADHWTGWCRLIGHHPVWTGSVVACSQCGRKLGK